MKVQHHCKFCRAPVTLEIDDAILEIYTLDSWKAMAACNRCADFLVKKHRLIDLVAGNAIQWSRHKMEQNPLDREQQEKLRVSLEAFLKTFCAHICEFYRVQFTFENDFTIQIMERPWKFGAMMKFYEKSIARLAKKPFVIAGRHYEHYETPKAA